MACKKTDGNQENSVIGNWELISKEDIPNGNIEIYPDSLDSKIKIEFTTDSVQLVACDLLLGSGYYVLDENENLEVSEFTFIEPCSLNGWVEIVANCIVHSRYVDFNEGPFKIISGDLNDFSLHFRKE